MNDEGVVIRERHLSMFEKEYGDPKSVEALSKCCDGLLKRVAALEKELQQIRHKA